MPTALVQGRIAVQYTDLLKTFLSDDWQVLVWDPAINQADEFAAMAAQADCIVGGGIPTAQWPAIPRLKLFQIPWTGYDFCSPATMPAEVPVCNCFEHESAIAEYVLGGMLEMSLGLRRLDRDFRKGGWNGKAPGENTPHGELRDQTVGIIGYGHIGFEVAKRAKAFDMRVIGTRRSQQETPELLDWLGTPDKMHQLLSESDYVVVACDLNAETEGMIGAAQLALMKPDAIIINVARGRVIAEQALFDALHSKQIGGAVLDVWYHYNTPGKPEVRPSELAFETLDNTLLSAHESASSYHMWERRWRFVAKNFERAAAGQKPENFVFFGSQQPTA
ncbi:MAG: NAD(P)-binding domain-containing protein [Rhodospirillales bacterium]|nr:NAD(P)-binding domain-containing protein [Rhodospirillales bacterium]